MRAYPTKGRTWISSSLMIIALLFYSQKQLAAQNAGKNFMEAQENNSTARQTHVESLPDSLPHYSFPPIEIEGRYLLKNKKQDERYHQLYLDIKRIYPLSKIVIGEIRMVNEELDSVYQTKAARKRYLKWYERHTYHTYLDTLKSLNARQTKLFIKLIHRETGSTPYDLIRKYRGGMDAFVWQLAANAMLLNLKTEYDPREEAMVEDILNRFY